MKSDLSIVIRTFNSAKTLKRLLGTFSAKFFKELIIVDSGSSDNTLTIASEFKAKIVSLSEPFHYSKSLNKGFSVSTGSWVLVISSHCIPLNENFLEKIFSFISSAPSDCAVGYGLVGVSPPKLKAPLIIGNSQSFQHGLFSPGGNGLAVYRKSFWEEHPFSEIIDTAEDLEWFLWAMKTGLTARHIPEATAIYLNQGGCLYMFRKGWLEVRHFRMLVPASRKSCGSALISLAVSCAYYLWLACCFKISLFTLLSQLAHSLGSFWGDLFFRSDLWIKRDFRLKMFRQNTLTNLLFLTFARYAV